MKGLARWGVCGLFGLAVSAQALAGTPTPSVAREQARSVWQIAIDDAWRRWRIGEITPASVPGFDQDMTRVHQALIDAGVLSSEDEHAWPVGCRDFSMSLAQSISQTVSPMGLTQWTEWRAVYRVTCGPLLGEQAQVQRALDRISPALLPPSPGIPWDRMLLAEVALHTWECMANHVPTALRLGLDRHEGLKLVARQCGVDPALVFGSAQRCDGCVVHPRQPRQLLFRTWAHVQPPPIPGLYSPAQSVPGT